MLAIVLAAAGTVVLTLYVRSADDRAQAGQTLVDVLVVTRPVERGTPVSELGNAVELQQLPAEALAQGAVTDASALEGLVAAVDLVPGEQLLSARFTEAVNLSIDSPVEVPEGMQEVTISLPSPERVVGGQLRPGDYAGIFASFREIPTQTTSVDESGQPVTEVEMGVPTTKLILHQVLVTNVQAIELPPPAPEQAATQVEQQVSQAPTAGLLVTFAVTTDQAERIVYSTEFGTIWLSSEPIGAEPGDDVEVTGETILS